MTTFTDKELIKEIKERIGSLDVRDNIERRAYEIALASLEAEPLVPVMYKGMKLLTKEGLELIRDGIAEATGLEAMCMADALLSGAPAPVVPDDWQLVPKKITLEMECALSKADSYEIGWLWALAAAPKYEVQNAKRVQNALNACRAAMLQRQGEGNPHVTPARLPGGFTIEDAKALHEDLVRSHISQALSGEKMKKKDRDADLRWIHDVIVQAAWFVKASLEKNALSVTPPVTPDGWISCSERMPEKNQNVLISVNFDSSLVEPLICSARYTGSTFRRGDATIKPGNGIEQATHWMPLPELPQEVN